MRPDAAASITRLAAAFEAAFGRPLYLSDAYRTYAQQVSLKVTKGEYAATPGTSNHGWGIAIDAASRVNVDGSDEHRWMEANAPPFGWLNPYWAVDYNPGNGQHEPWHWEYSAARDTHPTPTQETDMDAAQSKSLDECRRMLGVLFGWQPAQGPEAGALAALRTTGARGALTDAELDAIQLRVNAALVSDIIRGPEFRAVVAGIVKANLPAGTGGVGVSLEQIEAAVKAGLATLTLKSV